eukprot:scaffold5039_cov255-Pinguiococcus_pyrenoidosus.AAC.7
MVQSFASRGCPASPGPERSYQLLHFGHILLPVEQEAIRWQAVSACPAGLLIVSFDALRERGVAHVSDVRLVDAHAVGNRRADDADLALLPLELHQLPLAARLSGVVVVRRYAIRSEEVRGVFRVLLGHAVDDASLILAHAVVLHADVVEDLLLPLRSGSLLVPHGETQVRAVEGVHEDQRAFHLERLHDRCPDSRRGGGRHRQNGDVGKLLAQLAQLAVVRAEVVAPLRHAVRLVHHDPSKQSLRSQRLRRHVQQLQPGLHALSGEVEVRFHLANDLRWAEGRNVSRWDASVRLPRVQQRRDLVHDQRDQRGDDHREALAEHRRQLERERLATAGGHDQKDVSLGECAQNGVELPSAEVLEAPELSERVLRELFVPVAHTPRCSWSFVMAIPRPLAAAAREERRQRRLHGGDVAVMKSRGDPSKIKRKRRETKSCGVDE